MQQELPFYDSPLKALEACVQALGGAKKVGSLLFPEKTIDNARTYLLACLNDDRSEKLSLDQILWLFMKAKEIGFHGPFAWFSGEIGYDTKPITKADEVDRLTTVVEQSSKALAAALATLERLQQGGRTTA